MAGLPALDARAVAKAWLLELIAASPLEDAAALPTGELAQEGPGLAAAVLAALADDTSLMRLAPGGNLAWLSARAAALAGATGPAGAVRAAEALRRATQSAILTEARLDAPTTAELADRLAFVCAVVAEAAATESAAAAETGVAAESPGRAENADARPTPLAEAAPGTAAAQTPAPEPTAPAQRTDPRPAPITAPEAEVVSLHRGAEALRERLDRRAEQGSYETAVERRLERHAHDGSPFALLAVEADGLERLLAAQEDGEVDELLEVLERSLAAELRPADQLLREAPGRYWVTAPDTGPAVGRLLAERLAEAAAGAGRHRGTPLAVSIGVATCPEDGQEADALAARADRAMFQARAAGTPVV